MRSSRTAAGIALICGLMIASTLPAADPPTAGAGGVTVFETHTTDGVETGYRIPALAVSKKGHLLAFCEKRVGLDDHAENDIVLRRGVDGGESWLPIQVIANEGGDSLNDPCVVVLDSGRIILRYVRYPKGVHANNSETTVIADPGYDGPKNVRVYLTHSDDDGETWSPPQDVSRSMRRESAVALGSPGTGIVLTRGPNRGRILFPNYEVYHLGGGKRNTANSVSYSDDMGRTWKLTDPIAEPDTSSGTGDEAQLVELTNGGVLLSARDEPGGSFRKLSVSPDGGKTWSRHRVANDLMTPTCMSSLLRFSWPQNNQPGLILHTLPNTKKRRENGTLFVSEDEGATWKPLRVIVPEYFGYSCLARLPNGGDIGCLYETDDCHRIVFMRIPPNLVL